MILKKLGDLWWKFHAFGGGLFASALSLSQINKLRWARHFNLTDSKEWIILSVSLTD